MLRGYNQDVFIDEERVEDKGLFTFYREQAEYEQKVEGERRELLLRRRKQKQEQQRIKKEKIQFLQRIREEDQVKERSSQLLVKIRRRNPTIRAKEYIKQIQRSGRNKGNQEYKKKLRRYLDESIEPSHQGNKINLRSSIKMDELLAKSSEIFANRREIGSKLNHYHPISKAALAPKQFASAQVFRQHSPTQAAPKYSKQHSLRVPLPQLATKPKISLNLPSDCTQLHQLSKQRRPLYSPTQIIQNNYRYRLQQSSPTRNRRFTQEVSLSESAYKDSSIHQLLQKFRQIK